MAVTLPLRCRCVAVALPLHSRRDPSGPYHPPRLALRHEFEDYRQKRRSSDHTAGPTAAPAVPAAPAAPGTPGTPGTSAARSLGSTPRSFAAADAAAPSDAPSAAGSEAEAEAGAEAGAGAEPEAGAEAGAEARAEAGAEAGARGEAVQVEPHEVSLEELQEELESSLKRSEHGVASLTITAASGVPPASIASLRRRYESCRSEL